MASIESLLRLGRTVRHLRASQVAWRLIYMTRRRLTRKRVGLPLRSTAPLSLKGFPPELLAHPPVMAGWAVFEDLRKGRLDLVGERRAFAGGRDWFVPPDGSGRLWSIHTQYHEWILALVREHAATGDAEVASAARRWLRDWFVSAPSSAGFAWNSYAIATRIRSWIRIMACASEEFWAPDPSLRTTMEKSLWLQAEHLYGAIEWDLRGNHLVRDMAGLAWAARAFGAAGERFRKRAISLALSQCDEQVLDDGGHFERSPVYHLQVMEDFEETFLLLDDERMRARLEAVLHAMAQFASWMRGPDHGPVPFNDAAGEDCRTRLARVLQRWPGAGSEMPQGFRFFPDTAFAAWLTNAWQVWIDVGGPGPAYQPGHSHASSLTLNASAHGVPFLVDPGTHSYDRDAMRAYERSTAAHNTVTIDDASSSEVWDIFRVGRRARVSCERAQAFDHGFELRAVHDGYRHLAGGPVHERAVRADRDALEVVDVVTGGGHHVVRGGWLFAPEWSLVRDASGWLARHPDHPAVRLVMTGAGLEITINQRPYFPALGTIVESPRLEWTCSSTLPCTVTTRFIAA